MIFEVYIWIICFVGLYVSLFWMNIMFLEIPPKVSPPKRWPKVSFIVPAWNKEKDIAETIESLLSVDYPDFELVIVNDESTDNTVNVIKKYLKDKRVKLYHNKHRGIGKSSAVNHGIRLSKGELIAVVDADCQIAKNSMKFMVPYFQHKEVGAVMTPVKVKNPKTFFEKMQRVEYILTSFMRRLMSYINTIQVTPGALSLYRKSTLIKIGGFDENNITEDMEMALKLHYNNYKVIMEPEIDTYTYVPDNLKELWQQRTRWYSGFMINIRKYRKMMMSKKHGMMGMFQVPLNIISLFIIFSSLILFAYQIIKKLHQLLIKLITYKWDIFSTYQLPKSITEIILNLNLKIMFPLVITFLFALYIYYKAHQYTKEEFKYPLAIFIYLFLYPFFRTGQWFTALFQITFNSKRRW